MNERLRIMLNNEYTARMNWCIMYGSMLSPEDNEIRHDISSYEYNNWLCKKGKRLTTRLSNNYNDVYEMLFSFINDYDSGIVNLIKSERLKVIVSGLILIALRSLNHHEITAKDCNSTGQSLSLSRYLVKRNMSDKEKKWGLSSKKTMVAAFKEKTDVIHYCAAYAYFYKTQTRNRLVTEDGLDDFFSIAEQYKEFATTHILPQPSNSSVLDELKAPIIPSKFTFKVKSFSDPGYYTKEQVDEAEANYDAKDCH